MVHTRRDIASVVAHMPGVRAEVRSELEGRAARVRAVVAAHRDTGRLAEGTNVQVGATDTHVVMEHPHVEAINFGHVAENGRWVEGIHAIEAGL